MRQKLGIRATLTMAVLSIACAGAAPKPEAVPPLPENLVAAATDAVSRGQFKELEAKVVREIEPFVSGATLNQQPQRIIPLAGMREFARYFGRISKLSSFDSATLQWLLSHPKLLQTLMMAVSDKDQPDKVLAMLSSLKSDQGEQLEQYPDLAAAMCVVWDQPFEQAHGSFRPFVKPLDPQRPRMLMRFYINARSQLKFNSQELPWQLSAYMVDNLATPDDIAWALNRYAGHGRIGAVFFDVEYDYEKYQGIGDRLGESNYTLENILKRGGICGDQAYYAAQVARSIGVPATICTGTNANEGTGHAWVGYLGAKGANATWDFEEGRYPENRYWKGDVIDPQTREHITDAEVSVLAELMATANLQRLSSSAICKVADLSANENQPNLYMFAVNLSPGNRGAWTKLAELGAKQKLSPKQMTDLSGAVAKFAVHDFPDFAYKILKQANSGRGTAQQIKALADMQRQFSNRPDLQADIELAMGDLHLKDKQQQEAYNCYTAVLDRYPNVSPIVMDALDHLDRLMREAKLLPQLADAYEGVWKRMPQPDTSIAIKATPYYRIGERYERLLLDLGETNNAQQVRTRLDSLTQTVTALRPKQ
jgi:hypothetical protein